jgi:ABC-type multidrug transport system ATPase subunit
MALMVPPKILLLDEISNGVDPMARRSLYSYLKSLKETTTILITHRIDEAEKICDQIGIIVEGQIRAIGSPHILKEKNGNNFMLQVTVNQMDETQDSLILADRIIKERIPFCRRIIISDGDFNEYEDFEIGESSMLVYHFDEIQDFNRIERKSGSLFIEDSSGIQS